MGNDISGFGDFGLFDKCILVLLFISMVSIGILPHALEPYLGFYHMVYEFGQTQGKVPKYAVKTLLYDVWKF